jgi:hypothetical protein
MSTDKKTELAMALYRLGVSQEGVTNLLWRFPEEQIETQLRYLPYRKAKRPEAFIIEAIRKNYSPPKEFYYAQDQAHPAPHFDAVDEGAKPRPRPVDAAPQGHGTPATPSAHPADDRLEPRAPSGDRELRRP